MAKKNFLRAPKFEKVNKSALRIQTGHTRTGACTAHGRCNHGTFTHRH